MLSGLVAHLLWTDEDTEICWTWWIVILHAWVSPGFLCSIYLQTACRHFQLMLLKSSAQVQTSMTANIAHAEIDTKSLMAPESVLTSDLPMESDTIITPSGINRVWHKAQLAVSFKCYLQFTVSFFRYQYWMQSFQSGRPSDGGALNSVTVFLHKDSKICNQVLLAEKVETLVGDQEVEPVVH